MSVYRIKIHQIHKTESLKIFIFSRCNALLHPMYRRLGMLRLGNPFIVKYIRNLSNGKDRETGLLQGI